MARHAASLLAAALVSATAAQAAPQVAIVPLPFAVTEFRAPGSRVAALVGTTDALRGNKAADQPLAVVWGDKGGAALGLKDGAVVALPLGAAGDLSALEHGRDAIPGSRVQSAGPITVTLTTPTHAPGRDGLGSDLHAAALTVVERRPVAIGGDPKPVPQAISHVQAGEGAVFEDRAPRLVDLDGDGVPEIVTILSRKDGPSLAIIGRQGESWNIRAISPAAGHGTQLNPAAIADFSGSGHPLIAIVRDPDGGLELWSLAGGQLAKQAEKAGYADHAPGGGAQDLAAAVDLDGSHRPTLVLPTQDRSALAILNVQNGIVETGRIPLPARAATGVAVLGTGAGTHVLVGLEDGRVADIRP